MTSNELQQIVNTVIQTLREGAKTIDGLPESDSVGDADYIEISGGKKCALSTLRAGMLPEPNLVGQFADDSQPEDWYWWPDGVKTALPVDPVTKRFSCYYPNRVTSAVYLFAGGSVEGAFANDKLVRLEKLPACGGNFNYILSNLKSLEAYPVIDCKNATLMYGQFRDVAYAILGGSLPGDLWFANTGEITTFEMVLNNGMAATEEQGVTRVYGVDLSSATSIASYAFGQQTCLISAVNLGKAQGLQSADFRSDRWGDDSQSAGARKSVIDTLLTNSFDRSAAGYGAVTIRLSEYTAGLLTDAEKAAITSKGYSITTE